MIIILTVIIIALTSFFLTFVSMRNFAHISAVGDDCGLFLVSNPQFVNSQTIAKLYAICQEKKTVTSIERLLKGNEHALGFYLPKDAISRLSELGLIELEDYVREEVDNKKLNSQNSIVWQPNMQKAVITPHFLENIDLAEDDRLSFQIIAKAQNPSKREPRGNFKIVVRILVSATNMTERIKIAKRINLHLEKVFGLRQSELQTSPQLFKAFVLRSYLTRGKENELSFEEVNKYLT